MEPRTTALELVALAALLTLAALATRLSGRFGVPSLLFFLLLGMLARAQPWAPLPPPDFRLVFRAGAMALALILFDGGLNTSLRPARSVLGPSLLLATVGVVVTAAIVAVAAALGGLGWPTALLLGAAVSSTDAAAVFSVLRATGARLHEKVGLTLELEGGLNDPMAVLLTFSLADALAGGRLTVGTAALTLVLQLGVGALVGVGAGYGGRFALQHARLPSTGLYPVLTLALAFGAFGVATLARGSGFLAVYLTGALLGAGRLPLRANLRRVHDALAWVAQITMFLLLGLSIRPAALPHALLLGSLLAAVLALVARPLAVLLCLAPFRYRPKERLFVAFVGLRGAVPIVLATYPLIRHIAGAQALFELVFAMVVVNSVVPGALAGRLAQALGLHERRPPPAPAGLEMISLQDYDGDFVSYYVGEASAVAGAEIQELPLPAGCAVTLVVRGRELVPPRGDTRLEVGDHVYLFTKAADRTLVDLLFGLVEE